MRKILALMILLCAFAQADDLRAQSQALLELNQTIAREYIVVLDAGEAWLNEKKRPKLSQTRANLRKAEQELKQIKGSMKGDKLALDACARTQKVIDSVETVADLVEQQARTESEEINARLSAAMKQVDTDQGAVVEVMRQLVEAR